MSAFQIAGCAATKAPSSVTHSSSSSTVTRTPSSASQSWPPVKVRDSPTTSEEIPNWRTSPEQYQQGDSVLTIVVPR